MKASEKARKTTARSPSPRPRAASVRKTPAATPRPAKKSASPRGAARSKPAAVPVPARAKAESPAIAVQTAPARNLRVLWVVFYALLGLDLVLLGVVLFR
jgi:hypothetical protein